MNVFGSESGFLMVSLGPFRAMFEAPHPIEVGGLRHPTFPGTYTLELTNDCFDFDLKRFADNDEGIRVLVGL